MIEWRRKGLLISLSVQFSILGANASLILSKEGESFQQGYGVPSSMLPSLPSGRVLELFTSPDSGLLGGTVWPAAHSLCSYLVENQHALHLKKAKCVELGSGTGAVGLFAAGLGANVILTDCRPPPDSALYTTDGTATLPHGGSGDILKLLEKNVEANKSIFPINAIPKVMELDWTNHGHVESVAEKGEFDIVLASDVTHFSLIHRALATTIARLLRQDGGVCLLSHQERMLNLRGQDMQLHEFLQVAESSGLHVEQLHVTSTQYQTGGESQGDSRISMLLLRHMSSSIPQQLVVSPD